MKTTVSRRDQFEAEPVGTLFVWGHGVAIKTGPNLWNAHGFELTSATIATDSLMCDRNKEPWTVM